MADENEVIESTETENIEEEQADTVDETAEEIEETEEHDDVSNWKKESRKWERLTKKETSEKEKALARAEAAEKELEALKAKDARNSLISTIATEKGIDSSILSRMAGESEEDIRQNAAFIADYMTKQLKTYQKIPDSGEPGGRVGRITPEDIKGIKNPSERVRTIAQNLDLY